MIITPFYFRETTVTPTLALTAYAHGQAIGVGQLFVRNAVPSLGGQSRLAKVVITDTSQQEAHLRAFLYATKPAATVDQTAYAPLIADLTNFIGVVDVPISAYSSMSGASVAVVDFGYGLAVKILQSTGLYMQLMAMDAPTYATASALTFKFTFEMQ